VTAAPGISTAAAIAAATAGNLAELRRQVNGGAPLEPRDQDGPLLVAAQHGRLDCLRFLLEHGAHANYANNKGSTALMWACHAGNLPMVELLFLHGADRTCKDDQGRTPASFAQGKAEITALLNQNPDEISWYTKVDDHAVQDVYNFRLKERFTFVRKQEGGAVEAVTRQGFSQLTDLPSLRKAFALHRGLGGTVPEEEVFEGALGKPTYPRLACPRLTESGT
jgi:hypothetical protein